ncbi:hypothetical protein [Pelagicoccus mobilis]|uniref:Uncharacterized protein n=1 Tax=Pelagicoccus mobilis TaxID=415221 RepID=A0A934VQI4_9BACT|nr:hypothetical protein [Pelagicoccus mobilis]MBK1876935.1 hypothetical protein [Pelagicoccus mobilis]
MRFVTRGLRVIRIRWIGGWAGVLVAGVFVLSGVLRVEAQEEAPEVDKALEAAAEAALARVEADAEKRGVRERRSVAGMKVRGRHKVGTEDPVYRSGVPYFEEWTIRAGAMKLRVPAYLGWQAVKPNSDFYLAQSKTGRQGELLVLPLMFSDFVRATRSKYVNYFGLLWVPQETAFQSLGNSSFAGFKAELQNDMVVDRKRLVGRDDFWDFEDYMAFRKGRDEDLEESLDGYWLKALDEPDLVSYFATSEFVFVSSRGEQRQPMIQTMTYALVRGKLLRFDFKRLHFSDEDAVELIKFTKDFVEDMRIVNGLSERKIR